MREPAFIAEPKPGETDTVRRCRPRGMRLWLAVVVAGCALLSPAHAQETVNRPLSLELPESLTEGPERWTSPEGLSSTLQVMLMLTVLSLAPAVLLMTTCFVRIVVVLGLLRQAVGTQQLPPSQVITSLALFLTLLIMSPVWKRVYDEAIRPYTDQEITLEEAWSAGVVPIRDFMVMQIQRCENGDDVLLFMSYLPDSTDSEDQDLTYDDVPLEALLPAFMLSELKTAFLIGFQIYLPFLIIDMVIASVMVSMGMLMLPPVIISLPFKLLLFVLVDGWHLVVGMLMESFQAFT
ncbi:MAG: flagellar type III secretion system pore protein FliP [Planctomycetota bacterium]|jgi:flagellar biosynthetic protein FliP